MVGGTLPVSTAGGGVNACAYLGPNYVWVVGEGASVVISFGLSLNARKSVSSKIGYAVLCSEYCGLKKERRKSSTYRTDGSIANDD